MTTSGNNSFSIEKLLNEIQKLVREIELHKNDKLKDLSEKKEEILAKYQVLQQAMSRFRKFNSEFFEKNGIIEEELKAGARTLAEGSEGERLLALSEKVKIDLLMSYASFLHKVNTTKKAAFFEESSQQPETQKEHVKKKFKTMHERMKWKKM